MTVAFSSLWILFLWILIAFSAGSLPLSVWVGRLAIGVDVRDFGDGNPGATNVYRAGGRLAALAALLLDFLKGALPVALACYWARIPYPGLMLIALAPVAGHAFSPFLNWRGGKAVAVTFGVWVGLTAWEGPMVLGLCLLFATKTLGANGWAVLSALALLAVYFAAIPASAWGIAQRPESGWLILTIAGNMLLVGWKHRADFRRQPWSQVG